MSLRPQEISRAANSLIAEFGKEAEAVTERKIVDCTYKNCLVTAEIWQEVRTAITQIKADKAARAGSVGRERSNEPQS